jgi:hypothetical protein
MLEAADRLLTAVHVLFILGFVLLWIPRSTIVLHRLIVALTAGSWLVLGFFRGFGYCFLTDIHWRVKHALGVRHLPSSFIKYAGDFLTGTDLSPRTVDAVAGTVFVLGVGAAVYRWAQEKRESRRLRATRR